MGTADDALLVERDAHRARLVEAVESAKAGEGSLIVVEGPPGIGKTGLLGAGVAHAAEAGMTVVSARSRELERDFTLGVVRQLFERTLHGADDETRARLLAGPAAHGFATLSDGPGDRHATPGDSDFAAMHSLYWLAANLAEEGPLMLAVDDAHWADAASLRFLTYLANRLAGLPVLIVCATRPRVGGTTAAILDELAAVATEVLALGVLSEDGTTRIVRARVGPPCSDAFAQACHASSGGNPFLLHELLSALVADAVPTDDDGALRVRRLGPQSVSRAVFLRMARLPPGAADFARAVAILGDSVELRDAAALAQVSEDDAHALADALSTAGVLAAELPLRFIHPVILEAVSADLGAGQRTAMHLRAAMVLHERGAGPDQVAAHLSAVGPVGDAWVVDVLRRAASAATDRGAPEVAARHLERALREEVGPGVRAALLAELGEAEWMAAGDPAAVIEHMREAAELTDDPAVRVSATITMARAIFSTGDAVRALATLLEALQSPAVLGPEGTVRLEAEFGSVGLLNFDLMPEARTRLLALRDQMGTDPGGEPLLLANFAVLAWLDGTAAETAAVARAALAEGRLLAESGTDTIAFLQAIWVLLGSDELDEARRWCAAGLAQARERGSAFGFQACCVLASMTAYRAGDLRESEAHARTGIDLAEAPLFLRPASLAYLALALIERGELEEASVALDEGLVGEWLPPLAQMNIGFYARGLLRIAQGREAEALEDLREFGRREAYTGVENGSVDWRVPAARVLLRMGASDEARVLLDSQEAVARRWGTNASLGCALAGQAAGVVARGEGDGIALLESAVELLEDSPCRLQLARAGLELGMALRRAGRRSDACARLAVVVELARACGATVLAERANSELEVAGARPRHLQFSGADSLTASERRVALMAADGQTNAQIAQALFVTAKTVENHLGRVYIKLGINSRGQLGDALSFGFEDEGSSLMRA
ncbi:helix-turn-helix transcriptional regulator [Baekduia sp. Peel2402]|uniref:helix-turn-helix transcriptional regulator n=1 Tax=Baekduia sp. Peel2402 TaxID=3458296 RepID=UPI00403EDED4